MLLCKLGEKGATRLHESTVATPEGAAVMLYGLAWPAGRLLVVC